ncbi:hypothetical protein RZS08_02340, partial [Arthrospira platensis SPKY1]|nr:hypothetical protein [Arthrospira platensis SPKY1]
MKEFVLQEQLRQIKPNQYTKNSIVVAVIAEGVMTEGSHIYILNSFSFDPEKASAVAYSLCNLRVWTYDENIESLITKILREGGKVYEFEKVKEFSK